MHMRDVSGRSADITLPDTQQPTPTHKPGGMAASVKNANAGTGHGQASLQGTVSTAAPANNKRALSGLSARGPPTLTMQAAQIADRVRNAVHRPLATRIPRDFTSPKIQTRWINWLRHAAENRPSQSDFHAWTYALSRAPMSRRLPMFQQGLTHEPEAFPADKAQNLTKLKNIVNQLRHQAGNVADHDKRRGMMNECVQFVYNSALPFISSGTKLASSAQQASSGSRRIMPLRPRRTIATQSSSTADVRIERQQLEYTSLPAELRGEGDDHRSRTRAWQGGEFKPRSSSR